MNHRWRLITPPQYLIEEVSKELAIPPLIARVLINRGIKTPEEAERFLSPSLRHLPDPFLMKDMEKGVERIVRAIQKQERIAVYGDYDADGITATSLLIDFLRSLGLDPLYYIPNRLKEGYGLNAQAINEIALRGVTLLICVDCGVGNREEVQLAHRLRMDTIVVDHHEVPTLPSPAYATLNPLQPDCPFPFKGLAGVGVAFYLLIALRSRLRGYSFWKGIPEPNLRCYLDLVALGTIADIVPLCDTNRVLVTYGMRELQRGMRPGIKALKQVSGIGEEEISTGHVSFRLAPRLNAGGRLGDGRVGVELLLTDIPRDAERLAALLDEANRERQRLEDNIYAEALDLIKKQGLQRRLGLVLYSERWHPGVIGIVASRIAEEFSRPTIIISLDGDLGKGSARSVAGFHLYEGLQRCQGYLLGFGGHRYAAGLKISRDKIAALCEVFDQVVKGELGDAPPFPTLNIDAEVDLKELTPEVLPYLYALPPYGLANPKPIFATRQKVLFRDIRVLGKETLKFYVQEPGGTVFEVIGFGMGGLTSMLPVFGRIAFSPIVNEWQGERRFQLELRDVEVDSKG